MERTRRRPSETLSILDGNVLMMAVPMEVKLYDEYVNYMTRHLMLQMTTARIVIVCFDDPKYVPDAKRATQQKRDAVIHKKKVVCSEDLAPIPTTDNFEHMDLLAVADCHPVMRNRSTRQRFVDDVMMHTFHRIYSLIERCEVEGTLIIEGVDRRGSTRPYGAPRETAQFSTQPHMAALLKRRTPIGEGDLVMRDIDRAVREAISRHSFGKIRCIQHHTVDTDSFPICLMHAIQRTNFKNHTEMCYVSDDESDGEMPIETVICIREPSRKRRSDVGHDEVIAASILWAYVDPLCRLLVQSVIPMQLWHRVDPSMIMRLIACSWALSGCDFVSVKSATAEVFLDAIRDRVCQVNGLSMFARLGEVSSTPNMEALHAIRTLCESASERAVRNGRRNNAFIHNVNDNLILRAMWTVRYWNGHSAGGVSIEEWGFPSLPEEEGVGVEDEVSEPKKRARPEEEAGAGESSTGRTRVCTDMG